jgi:acetolactate synthase-1/2/3 large subunit
MKAKGKAQPVSMTGGMAIVEALIANGVDTVYGLPGAQLYPLFDALQQRSDAIKTYGARHEQACGYMAFGHARSTGKPGVYAVVPGPGVLNTTAALCTAFGTSTPVLCVTGQVPSQFLGRNRGHLHELSDQLGALKPFTKSGARIERAADAPAIVNEAFRQMLSGRPGPVVIEMPWDTMAQSGMVVPLPAADVPSAPPPSATEIEAAARLVVEAKRPIIMVGSGAQNAADAVLALAEEIDAPVTAFRGGRGVVSERHDLGVSSYVAYKLWPETDLVIAIGTRLELPTMRWTGMMKMHDRLPGGRKLVRIDIDPAEMRHVLADAPVVADAEAATEALRVAVKRMRGKTGTKPAERKAARAHIAQAKKAAPADYAGVKPQVAYLEVIRDLLPDDGLFVPELSQVGFASYFAWDVRKPRTYVSEGYQGTLGFGFPTALGAKAANPDKPVVAVTGDGGFMFAVQELATAVQYGIAVVVLLFNNASYGNVMRDQKMGFGNRIIGSALQNPDFMGLAQAFGVTGHRVASPEALRPVLAKALKSKAPVLIEIDIPQGSEASPWAFIHPKPVA